MESTKYVDGRDSSYKIKEEHEKRVRIFRTPI
jgi:hypothetical protein